MEAVAVTGYLFTPPPADPNTLTDRQRAALEIVRAYGQPIQPITLGAAMGHREPWRHTAGLSVLRELHRKGLVRRVGRGGGRWTLTPDAYVPGTPPAYTHSSNIDDPSEAPADHRSTPSSPGQSSSGMATPRCAEPYLEDATLAVTEAGGGRWTLSEEACRNDPRGQSAHGMKSPASSLSVYQTDEIPY